MTAPRLSPSDPAMRVWQKLRDAGHETYFCGGCVRDALMERAPKDFDITTAATPEQVEALFPKTVPVGKAFGVMIVVEDGIPFEVATFRSDLAYLDGRRPKGVVFTTAEEDVNRRDFTINALLYDPETDTIIDHVGGIDDIKQKRLRTVGDPRKRFTEDRLRLLRAVRFAGRTGFNLETETRRAIHECAPTIHSVSAERIGEELRRMLTEGYAETSIQLLESTGLLLHVLPEVAAMRGVPQPPKFHPEGCVLTHTLLMLKMLDTLFAESRFWKGHSESDRAFQTPDATELMQSRLGTMLRDPTYREILAFAILLHDIGKPQTLMQSDRIRFNEHDDVGAALAVTVLRRLKRPNEVIDGVRDLIGRHMHFAALPRMRRSKRRRIVQDPLFPLHLELHHFDCNSSHRILTTYRFGLEAQAEEASLPPVREPLLTGHDLIVLGYAPGPTMGAMLRALEDARLEGEIETPAAANAWIAKRYPSNQAKRD